MTSAALAVDRATAVGFREIRLRFELDADAERLQTLLALTERYCVGLQTLRGGPPVTTELSQ